MMTLKSYPGNKSSPGVYHKIINQMTPHDCYIEPCAGSAAIYRKKKEAGINIIGEANPKVFYSLKRELMNNHPDTIMCHQDYRETIESGLRTLSNRIFIYMDCPYPMESRRSTKDIYGAFEWSKKDHIEMLEYFKNLDKKYKSDRRTCVHWMISSYPNELYDKELSSYRRMEFMASTHGGVSTEVIYMNYKEPDRLHDYQYIGKDWIDRQRIKRKASRTVKKLKNMPRLERLAILEQIYKEFD